MDIQTISLLIIIDFLFILNKSNTIRIFQTNGYKFVFNKKVKTCEIINFAISIFSFFIILIFYKYNLKHLAYILFSSFLIISYVSIDIYNRQKLSITKRLVRLYILMYIVNFFVLYFLDKKMYILVPIYFMFEYPVLVLANYINAPIEFLIKQVYIIKAKIKLKRKNLFSIGITGSAGKSSVKNILYEFLSLKYKVYKTEKNYNTTWGVIKSIDKIEDEEIFIVEMGARHVGDIKEICKIVKPKIGIITNVIKQHLNTFKSIDNIYKTKKELVDYASVAILNDNNQYVAQMQQENKEILTIKDMNYKILNFDGEYLEFEFTLDKKRITTKTRMLEYHNIENILLALKCALYLGVDKDQLITKIKDLKNIEHRFEINKKNGITIIDDSYNANIEGCMNAINLLEKFTGRKIIFTQGIVELSSEQEKENENLGKMIAKVADIVILLGVNSESIFKGLTEQNFNRENVIILKEFSKANEVFAKILKKGDVVLIQNDLTDNY